MDSTQAKKIVDSVTAERCTELAVTLVDIPSLTGNERPIAECVLKVLNGMGIDSYLQEFEPERFNVIGNIKGKGNGATLLLNGHMDISFSGNEQYLPDAPGYKPKAVVKDGVRQEWTSPGPQSGSLLWDKTNVLDQLKALGLIP